MRRRRKIVRLARDPNPQRRQIIMYLRESADLRADQSVLSRHTGCTRKNRLRGTAGLLNQDKGIHRRVTNERSTTCRRSCRIVSTWHLRQVDAVVLLL